MFLRYTWKFWKFKLDFTSVTLYVNAKRGVEIEWIKHHDCVAFLTLPLDSKVVTSRVDSLDGEDSLLTKGERDADASGNGCRIDRTECHYAIFHFRFTRRSPRCTCIEIVRATKPHLCDILCNLVIPCYGSFICGLKYDCIGKSW